MSAADKKAPGRNPEAHHSTNQMYFTTPRGRRAISSLWNAGRLIAGAQLSVDDLGLVEETLAEIRDLLELLK